MNAIELSLGYFIGFIISVIGGVFFVEFVSSLFPDLSEGEKIENNKGDGIKHAGKTI